MIVTRETLKNLFQTGLKPIQESFHNWLDSFWHKSENIPFENIEGIQSVLDAKTDLVDFEALETEVVNIGSMLLEKADASSILRLKATLDNEMTIPADIEVSVAGFDIPANYLSVGGIIYFSAVGRVNVSVSSLGSIEIKINVNENPKIVVSLDLIDALDNEKYVIKGSFQLLNGFMSVDAIAVFRGVTKAYSEVSVYDNTDLGKISVSAVKTGIVEDSFVTACHVKEL